MVSYRTCTVHIYLCPEKAVTLLLNVVIDDSRHLLLPDLESVDVDVVLNVFK